MSKTKKIIARSGSTAETKFSDEEVRNALKTSIEKNKRYFKQGGRLFSEKDTKR